MKLMPADLDSLEIHTDEELIRKYLLTDAGAVWVELGCGDASLTKTLAKSLPDIQIQAFEVDEIQHAKNLATSCDDDDKPSNLSFGAFGMQKLPTITDESVDAVIMLKSLHHVPLEDLDAGFQEVHRVLKPGGKLYISEPLFAGPFNDIMALFMNSHHGKMDEDKDKHAHGHHHHDHSHDHKDAEEHGPKHTDKNENEHHHDDDAEKKHHSNSNHHGGHTHSHEHHNRVHAFECLKKQVNNHHHFQLEQEIHFNAPLEFENGWVDFEKKICNVTFVELDLNSETMAKAKEQFSKHVKEEDGSAHFLVPMRVDVLIKPSE